MAGVANTTFGLYTDSGITTPLSGGIEQYIHKTDLSDNPQDVQLWLGSNASISTQLRASSNPGVDNIVLTPTKILPVWVLSTVYTLGQSVYPTVDNTYRYSCTTAGTSSSTQPTWPTTIGNTVTDGSVVWTCISKEHPITEIQLATTQAGLTGASAGGSLSLGNTLLSGALHATTFWIRVINTVTTVGDNSGTPEIGIFNNAVQEDPV